MDAAEAKRAPAGRYFHEPADRGSHCVIRYMAPHYSGRGEVIARNVELETAKRIAALLNSDAAAPELYETAAQAVGYLERICGLVPGEELDPQDVRDLLAARRSFYRAALAKAEGR